jgi:hypothetical protein
MSQRPRLSAERCSVRSELIGAPMFGTASTVRSWLLVEHGGPWGVHALDDARMRSATRAALREAQDRFDVRVLLIRRTSEPPLPDRRVTCFAVRSGPGAPWLERAELGGLDDVPDVDVEGLSRGESAGMTRVAEPLFVVCTHGRHDPCCAERGRPLARALARSEAEATWEGSHVGGDRFAGNLVAFPHGMYFGRLAPQDAASVTMAYRRGRIDLAHYRGRSCYATSVQAAEHLFRVDQGLDGVDDVRPVGAVRRDGLIVVTLVARAQSYRVTIERSREEPRVLTCHDTEPFAAPAHRLVAIEAVT